MITALVIIAWLVPALAVYRRVGYLTENQARRGHSYQNICETCKCKVCGIAPGDHGKTYNGSHSHPLQHSGGVHIRTAAMLLPVVAVWPVIALAYVVGVAHSKAFGSTSFFVAPPKIESKQEKRERELAEREAAATDREKALAAIEKELGIGVS